MKKLFRLLSLHVYALGCPLAPLYGAFSNRHAHDLPLFETQVGMHRDDAPMSSDYAEKDKLDLYKKAQQVEEMEKKVQWALKQKAEKAEEELQTLYAKEKKRQRQALKRLHAKRAALKKLNKANEEDEKINEGSSFSDLPFGSRSIKKKKSTYGPL